MLFKKTIFSIQFFLKNKKLNIKNKKFAIKKVLKHISIHANNWARTNDRWPFKPLLYQLSYIRFKKKKSLHISANFSSFFINV